MCQTRDYNAGQKPTDLITIDHNDGRKTKCTKMPRIQEDINATVDELCNIRFRTHSKSPYSSPIVVMKKEIGK